MNKRQALQIVIQHAAANVAGVGCGMRPGVSGDEKLRVEIAIRKLYREAYLHTPDESDFFNMGLTFPQLRLP